MDVALRPVEEQVAGTKRVERHGGAVPELRVGVARNRHPVRAVDGPDDARAVVAPGGEPTPEVADTEKALRLCDDRRGGVRQRILRAAERANAVRRTDDGEVSAPADERQLRA